MSDSTGTKKLKLTLKLSNSSSPPISTSASQLNSSAVTSPVKNETEAGGSELLPSGLGNLKGRGRPKKAAATKVNNSALLSDNTVVSNNTAETDNTSNTSNANNTATTTTNDYANDLKSFVSSMNSFKPRSWSLNRPFLFDSKTVSNHSLLLPCGLWCTTQNEPASSHLIKINSIETSLTSATATAPGLSVVFEEKCQCGKVFNDKSKYRKHLKTHKVAENAISEGTLPVAPVVGNPSVLSLKIKLNTSNSK